MKLIEVTNVSGQRLAINPEVIMFAMEDRGACNILIKAGKDEQRSVILRDTYEQVLEQISAIENYEKNEQALLAQAWKDFNAAQVT